jgi:hypothetical protein
MQPLSHHRASCHADFLTLPLGEWSRRTALEQLTPGGRHIQARTGLSTSLANVLAEVHGLGREFSR